MLFTALLLLAAPPSEPAAAKKEAVSPDKKVCRSVQEIYSRIPTRICRTQAEWDADAKQTQIDLENARRTGRQVEN